MLRTILFYTVAQGAYYRTPCRYCKGVYVGSPGCRACRFFAGIKSTFVLCRSPVTYFEQWLESKEAEKLYGTIPAEPSDTQEDPQGWADMFWWYLEHEEDIFNAGVAKGRELQGEQ